jgi:lysophospholipase L1-like esterase
MAALAAFAAIACGGGSKADSSLIPKSPQGGVYLGLGDSIAAGSGATDAATTSYVGLVDAAVKQRLGDGLRLQSLAVGGHTTQDLIDKQLQPALNALRAGDVRLVTITIGGNDLNILQSDPNAAACITDVNDPKCPVANILVGSEQRLDQILGALRAAGPKVPIVIEVYLNLFSGTGHIFEKAAGVAFGKLDDVIERSAQRSNVLVADPRAAFEGKGGQLTHTLDPTPDFHPNDAGYRLIAGAFLKVLGLTN